MHGISSRPGCSVAYASPTRIHSPNSDAKISHTMHDSPVSHSPCCLFLRTSNSCPTALPSFLPFLYLLFLLFLLLLLYLSKNVRPFSSFKCGLHPESFTSFCSTPPQPPQTTRPSRSERALLTGIRIHSSATPLEGQSGFLADSFPLTFSESDSVASQPCAERARAVEDPPEWVHLNESIRASSQRMFWEIFFW